MINYSEAEFKKLLKESLREIMQEIKPAIQNEGQILDVKQAADFLHFKVTTLYEKTSRKLIPHFKKGNKLYFNRAELEAWVNEGKIKSADEIGSEAVTHLLSKETNRTNKKTV
mgnify:CR=1 FL=1